MDKAQAVHNFMNSFTWKAYDEGTVPDDAVFPRITYQLFVDALDHPLSMAISLWDRSYSWTSVEEKAKEIAYRLYTMRPPAIPCDTGRVYIKKGSPFAQRMSDQADSMIRQMYINLEIEYFTAY